MQIDENGFQRKRLIDQLLVILLRNSQSTILFDSSHCGRILQKIDEIGF